MNAQVSQLDKLIQAALILIGQCRENGQVINLRGMDLRGMNLRGMDLRGANITEAREASDFNPQV